MKKLKNKLLALSTVLAIILCTVVISFTFGKENEKINTYIISAEVNNEYLEGEMKLKYNNKVSNDMLFFCLYPNAFKDEENVVNVAAQDNMKEAYPNGFDSGYINIVSVFVDGKEAFFDFEENKQILKVKINKNTDEIIIKFDEKLPHSPMRYGYGENTYNFGNWYPVLCPYKNGELVKCVYTSNGDPFCSDIANYDITVSAPVDFRLAASGVISGEKSADPTRSVWSIKAENVRDFAFLLSDSFKILSQKVNNTIVYSYYFGDDLLGQASLNYAVSSIKCFNGKFGEYPYSTYSVVASDFYIGGMEYPQLVLINKDYYVSGRDETLEEVIVHETAHQWWYGIVGNNELNEPWLDEGLTQYSVALFYEDTYGKNRYDDFMQSNENYCKVIFTVCDGICGETKKSILRKSSSFEHWLLYDALCYKGSALMLDSLRQALGDERFFDGIKCYYDNNTYSIADTQGFIEDFSLGSTVNIEAIITPWLNGSVYWG